MVGAPFVQRDEGHDEDVGGAGQVETPPIRDHGQEEEKDEEVFGQPIGQHFHAEGGGGHGEGETRRYGGLRGGCV